MPLGLSDLVTPAAKGPLEAVGGSISDAWMAVIGDRMGAWRTRNAISLQLQINKEAEANGLALDGTKIPERYAFAWFKEATVQDEPEIQELFARLLIKAAQGDDDATDRRHIEILGRLTPPDALAFKTLYSRGRDWPAQTALTIISKVLHTGSRKSLEHLIAVGICIPAYFRQGAPVGDLVQTIARSGAPKISHSQTQTLNRIGQDRLYATQAGLSLYRAVGS